VAQAPRSIAAAMASGPSPCCSYTDSFLRFGGLKRFSRAGGLVHTQRQARPRMHVRRVERAYRPRNSLKAAVTCALYLRAARHRVVSFCGCSYAPAARGSRGRCTAYHKGSSVPLPLSVPEPAAAASSSDAARSRAAAPRSRIGGQIKKKTECRVAP